MLETKESNGNIRSEKLREVTKSDRQPAFSGSWSVYITQKHAKLHNQFRDSEFLGDILRTEGYPQNPTLFQGMIVFVSTSLFYVHHYNNRTLRFDHSEFCRLILMYGGQVSLTLDRQVTHYVGTEVPLWLRRLLLHNRKSPTLSCQFLNPSYFLHCIEHNTRLSTVGYVLPLVFEFLHFPCNESVECDMSIATPEKKTTCTNIVNCTEPMLTSSENPSFVYDYFHSSRLHKLSTWKIQLQEELQAWITDSLKMKETTLESLPMNTLRFIAHLDMDNFFASVSLRKRSELIDKPVVISHGGRRAVVSSCNRVAMQWGLHKGMWLCEAIARCPHLCVLPYDFIDYEHVSKQIFAIFIKYTPFVQVVSCDEALLDLSTLSDISHVEDCVRRIREEVVTVTGCTCSAGIGSNPLLARLALRKAKAMGPNQQFTAPNIMDREHLLEWIGQFSVAALPGVGTKTQLQLRELGYDLISSLQHVEMTTLQQKFGLRHGRRLWEMAHGIDNTRLKLFYERKSISVEVTYGVRFSEQSKVLQFVSDVANELIRRMIKAKVRGRCVTLTVYQKCDDLTIQDDIVEDSEENDTDFNLPNTYQTTLTTHNSIRKPWSDPFYLGHGRCVKKSRTRSLAHATANSELIITLCLDLYNEFQLQPQQLRGLAIQMRQLEFLDNKYKTFRHSYCSSSNSFQKLILANDIVSSGSDHNTNQSKPKIETIHDDEFTCPKSNTNCTDKQCSQCSVSTPLSSSSLLSSFSTKNQSTLHSIVPLYFAEERFCDNLRTSFVVWLQKTIHPQRVHIELLQHYFTFLALVEKNLEDVSLLLNTFQRYTQFIISSSSNYPPLSLRMIIFCFWNDTESCGSFVDHLLKIRQSKMLPQWQQPFEEILGCLQAQILHHYGATLQLSSS